MHLTHTRFDCMDGLRFDYLLEGFTNKRKYVKRRDAGIRQY